MALHDKKGGRYTKKEQEERKMQVYNLHFEQGKSAVKIAELLNVNRNTINEDIKFWHQQIGNEINPHDIMTKLNRQIQRMEIQRDRLHENLEDAKNIDTKIRLEQFISDIDNKLVSLYSKMLSSGKESITSLKFQEIEESEINEFVRNLLLITNPDFSYFYSENELKFYFIQTRKCDLTYANSVILKMKQFGLDLAIYSDVANTKFLTSIAGDDSPRYDLVKFSDLRGYLTKDEIEKIK